MCRFKVPHGYIIVVTRISCILIYRMPHITTITLGLACMQFPAMLSLPECSFGQLIFELRSFHWILFHDLPDDIYCYECITIFKILWWLPWVILGVSCFKQSLQLVHYINIKSQKEAVAPLLTLEKLIFFFPWNLPSISICYFARCLRPVFSGFLSIH